MAKVERLESLVKKLRGLAEKGKKANVSAVVGYTQDYALQVHENRQIPHRVGRAGYLLDVAREMSKELGSIVWQAMKGGAEMSQALLMAGLRLQRESQANVPVRTGALRASAFTRLEET